MRKIILVAAVAIGLTSCSRDQPSPSPASATAASSFAVASATANAAPTNDGTDPKTPVLSPDDANFVDARNGFGWGDRCFNEIKQGKWGWAHAACDRALALPDVDSNARPPLLYNEGLIAKHARDDAAARNYFGQSLTQRSPTDPGRKEVERELASVGGAPPSTPVETFTGKAAANQMSDANVKATYANLDFTTLYHVDINNDGHMEWVLCESNSVGLHNDYISAVYLSAPTSGAMIDFTIPVPNEGPFGQGATYFDTPFLRNDPEGVTMTFLEGPSNRRTRYLWKSGHIRLLDRD